MQSSPPACLIQPGSVGLRLSPTYTLFYLWQVKSVNLSIPLTPIIRIPFLHLASPCSPTCRLLRLLLGNINLFTLCLFFLMFLYSFFYFVHSMQVKPGKKTKKDVPAQDPVVTEPALGTAAPDTSIHEPPPSLS